MMKRTPAFIFAVAISCIICLSWAGSSIYCQAFEVLDERYPGEMREVPGGPQEMALRISCSAQVYEAIEKDVFIMFEQQTGIEVKIRLDYYIASSDVSLERLVNGLSDIAASTRELDFRYIERGYVEIPFCKDSLSVIVNEQCPILNFSEQQVRDIFSGSISNWKALGGPDQPIIVVVPSENTGAYKNFSRMLMLLHGMKYDFMTHRSTMAIQAVEQFPWAISFITRAAIVGRKNIKTATIDGLAPQDKGYPYFQTFYLVTKGEPSGPAKAFINFMYSEEVAKLVIRKGMSPWSR